VLEIGTGSGYQAAVLAELVGRVYSIEIIEPLARQAAERLKALGYVHVETRAGDGYYGWEEAAPFDAIVVTAAASHVPPPLIRQLKPGGRMVIPVGAHFLAQYLLLVEKKADGAVTTRQILPVRFVPLTGSGHSSRRGDGAALAPRSSRCVALWRCCRDPGCRGAGQGADHSSLGDEKIQDLV